MDVKNKNKQIIKINSKNTKKEEFAKIGKSTNEYKNSIVIENEEDFVKKEIRHLKIIPMFLLVNAEDIKTGMEKLGRN